MSNEVKIRSQPLRDKIRILRIKQGISQTALSINIGRHKGYLQEYERGKQPNLPVTVIEKLAEQLKVFPEDLLDDTKVFTAENPISFHREWTDVEVMKFQELAPYISLEDLATYCGYKDSRGLLALFERTPFLHAIYKRARIEKIARVGKQVSESSDSGYVAGKIFYLKTQGRWKESMDNSHSLEYTVGDREERMKEYEEFIAWRKEKAEQKENANMDSASK